MTQMTKKDYNAVRHAMFEAAMQSAPIKDALSSMFDQQVWVFDLSEGQRHEIVLSRHEKGFTTNELRDLRQVLPVTLVLPGLPICKGLLIQAKRLTKTLLIFALLKEQGNYFVQRVQNKHLHSVQLSKINYLG